MWGEEDNTTEPTYVRAADSSCQSCGCDEGANHICDAHRNGLWPVRQRTGQPGVAAKPTVQAAAFTGIGGAPTRTTTLPDDPAERKKYPIASGVLDYFPDAIAAIAYVSWVGNEQHNPGKPLHWDRSKSADEADTMQRHFAQRGTRDKDNTRHTAKAAWRMLALLQKEIEQESA